MTKTSIYLDHAATTRLHPKALAAMLPFLSDAFGNPSGSYALGRRAARALDDARRTVAGLLNAKAQEIVFTGPGTESINAAIKGVALAQKQAGLGNHIVTTTAEHHAVLHSCEWLEKFGFDVTYVPVDSFAMARPEAVAAAVTERTVLVSVMLANNEVGTVNPVARIADEVRERGKALKRRIAIHADAVQGANALELDVQELGVDLLSLSAHKFCGPKGAGVLYMRRGTPFLSLQSGGGQERQRRAGTENVAGIVGTAVALGRAQDSRDEYVRACRRLSGRLAESVLGTIPGTTLNGHPEQRLPNNVHFSFEGARSDTILSALDKLGIAASAGSACNSATWEPSHVLVAMGLPLNKAAGALRLTVGAENTEREIERVLEALPGVVADSRAKAARG
ncbi:MAG TPA: aminotransferase class V-fold PLP-dependent enzyme [Dehalococcoidia bacterium]|nr:aminotransferase class V-fold PLP-dependent enzyme [Dehalococcoidia bacterium]